MESQRKAVIGYVFMFSLVLSGCSSAQIFPLTITTTPTFTHTPTQTPTVTATFTPTATTTPKPTATPGIKTVICTTENFLDPEHEIDSESMFDGTYLEALRKISTPFDPAKVKNVPLVVYESAGLNEITYFRSTEILKRGYTFVPALNLFINT